MSTSIQDILATAKRSSTLSTPQKKDIESHLRVIETELVALAAQDPEGATSILNFLVCVMHESTRKERTSVIAMAARKGMLLSFRPYEEKHPELTNAAYSLGNVLSALGV
jgi:N-acetylglutamate synthase/N-acetylornithine aminotransferase